jgi:threonine dehydratase
MTPKVYMPITAPISKVQATESYGGQIVQHGLTVDDSVAKCKEDLKAHPDWVFIPPYDDELVIAGQGTIGVEIYNQLPEVDTVVVPVGGGGLAAGVAIALKALKPSIRVVCVQAQTRPYAYIKYQEAKGLSVDLGPKFQGNPIADGINVKNTGSITFPYIRKNADEFVLVTEDEIVQTIALLAERGKVISEGAGASSVAAVLNHKFKFRPDEKIVCVVSGGNIELQMLSKCIERALFLWGRRIHFNVTISAGTDEYIKLLKLLREYHFEVVSTTSCPYVDALTSHVRYAITADIPNPKLLDEVKQEFNKNDWTMNISQVHATDE